MAAAGPVSLAHGIFLDRCRKDALELPPEFPRSLLDYGIGVRAAAIPTFVQRDIF